MNESSFSVTVVNSHQYFAKSNNQLGKSSQACVNQVLSRQKKKKKIAESTTVHPLNCVPSKLSVFPVSFFSRDVYLLQV